MSDNQWPKLRRQDRGQDDKWIEQFLRTTPAGQLAISQDNQPYVLTNTFAFDHEKHCLYFHTARFGHLRSLAESLPHPACFTASELGRFLPADTMKELSVEYASVVVFGRLSVVTEQKECRYGLELLAAKYFPHLKVGEDIRALTPAEVKETTVYRLDIDHWTGKQKREAPDFRGAFNWGERPESDA